MNHKTSNQLNSRTSLITTELCGILFALSLIPIVVVAPYVRSTGDDLNYSRFVHHTLENGGNIIDVMRTVWEMVQSTWGTWQGTWSSVALFSLQPGIWGNEWYPLTILIALICIVTGTWYLLHSMLRLLGVRGAGRWSVAFLAAIVMIQYMPNMKCGIFWWTSVAHYIIAYGITMMCMGWSLRWMEAGRTRYLVGMIIGMSYLGGAGYPEVVLGAVWFFLVIVPMMIVGDRARRKRALILLIPFALEMNGFAISAVAPGNKNRGGEDFGFSMSRVISTLMGCVADGITGTVQDMVRARLYLPLLVIVAVLVYIYYDRARNALLVRFPGLWTLAGLFIICIIRAPERYAGTEVSGGVPDSYWMVTMVVMILLVSIWTIWCKEHLGESADIVRVFRWLNRESTALVAVVFCLIVGAVGYRHLVGGTVDYVCIEYARSGQLADYRTQMGEWLELLENPELDSVVLPMMNDQQGPFMLMVPLEEHDNWSNWVYEEYYGKSSVICVPRDTYTPDMNIRNKGE